MDDSLDVCFCTLPLSSFGGAERLIAEEAAYFDDLGHNVHLISSEVSEKVICSYPFPGDISLYTLDSNRNWLHPYINDAKDYRRIFKKHEFDVVIAHYTIREVGMAIASIPGFNPWTSCHIHGTFLWFHDQFERVAHKSKSCFKQLIREVHGHNEFCEKTGRNLNYINKAKKKGNEALLSFSLSLFDQISVNTERVRKEVNCLYGIDPEVNRPGVSQAWIARNEPRENINLKQFDRTVLSVSRLDRRKRIDLLIKTISEMQNAGFRDIGLFIIGSGEERNKLEDLAEREGVAGNVQFLGNVSDDELSYIYRLSDVFACPGWMSYGIAPLEAYVSKTPVAISTDAYAHEVIGDSPSVEVVPPDVSNWANILPQLIDNDFGFDTNVVPSWNKFTKNKYENVAE